MPAAVPASTPFAVPAEAPAGTPEETGEVPGAAELLSEAEEVRVVPVAAAAGGDTGLLALFDLFDLFEDPVPETALPVPEDAGVPGLPIGVTLESGEVSKDGTSVTFLCPHPEKAAVTAAASARDRAARMNLEEVFFTTIILTDI